MDRQTHRKTYTQIDIQKYKYGRKTDKNKTARQTERQKNMHKERLKVRQKDRQTRRQKDRQKDRKTYRMKDRQTNKYNYLLPLIDSSLRGGIISPWRISTQNSTHSKNNTYHVLQCIFKMITSYLKLAVTPLVVRQSVSKITHE